MGLSLVKGGKRLADSGWEGRGRAEWGAALRTEWRAEWMRQADASNFRWRVAGGLALKGEPETG